MMGRKYILFYLGISCFCVAIAETTWIGKTQIHHYFWTGKASLADLVFGAAKLAIGIILVPITWKVVKTYILQVEKQDTEWRE